MKPANDAVTQDVLRLEIKKREREIVSLARLSGTMAFGIAFLLMMMIVAFPALASLTPALPASLAVLMFPITAVAATTLLVGTIRMEGMARQQEIGAQPLSKRSQPDSTASAEKWVPILALMGVALALLAGVSLGVPPLAIAMVSGLLALGGLVYALSAHRQHILMAEIHTLKKLKLSEGSIKPAATMPALSVKAAPVVTFSRQPAIPANPAFQDAVMDADPEGQVPGGQERRHTLGLH